jgi:hypothetical protein
VNSNRFRSVSAPNPFPASAYSKPPLRRWDTIDLKFEIGKLQNSLNVDFRLDWLFHKSPITSHCGARRQPAGEKQNCDDAKKSAHKKIAGMLS